MIKLSFGRGRLSLLTTVWLSVVLSIVNCEITFSHQTYALPTLIGDRSLKNSPADSTPKSFTCPNDVSTLTALLLKDLPAYSNRVIQRTQHLNQAAGSENYIITASQAEFKPLPLPRLQYDEIDSAQEPSQLFFTVLERQYIQNEIVDISSYHWLFLTSTTRGWQTVILFSRFGNTTENTPPAPPRDSTDGIIGQGIQLWLRDCNAGAVRQ